MDKRISDVDWSLVQAFLAVAETGSLSAAARALGASQPTLGRQIKAIEAQLGATLFIRQSRGFSLTETGAALMAPAQAMRDAMHQITLTAAGQQEALIGTVRITASVVMAAKEMPPIIADIREREPEISIELVASDTTRNLLYREADIAVRMYRPTQLDLITQHIGDLSLGIYAARSYVAKRGTPTPENFRSHDFVGYDSNPAIIDGFAAAGINVTCEFFQTRTDDQLAYWELVRSGCGIGFSQTGLAENDPDIVAIPLGFPIPALPVYLTAHEIMRRTPRIRRVWTLLAEGLKPLMS